MNPISQYKFYDLGAKLHRVTGNRTAVAAAEMFVPLMEAQAALDNLLKGDPIALELAKNDANALLAKLGSVFNKYFIDPSTRQFRYPARDDVMEAHELNLLRSLIEKFESSLAAELSRKAIYTVPKRGLFDTWQLAETAEDQFSEEVRKIMGDGLRDDVRAAGRCLAFGLGTAACFHLVRAVEAVLARYVNVFAGPAPAKSDVLWKEGVGRLHGLKSREQGGVDLRVLGLLADVDTRYRTVLFTPNANFSVHDAMIFFGMAGSLITLMMEAVAAQDTPQRRMRDKEEKTKEPLPPPTSPAPAANEQKNEPQDDHDEDTSNAFAEEASAASRRNKTA
jgi:hypothetical protein